MAVRYSGKVRVSCVYLDRGDYKCAVTWPGGRWSGHVRPPASGFGAGIAYDSPAAYDRTAHAAISFAEDANGGAGVQDEAAHTEHGWHVSRTKAGAWGGVSSRGKYGTAGSIARASRSPTRGVQTGRSDFTSRVFSVAYAYTVAKGRGGAGFGYARANAVAAKKRRELESLLEAAKHKKDAPKWWKDSVKAAAKRGVKAGREHLKVFGKKGPVNPGRDPKKRTRRTSGASGAKGVLRTLQAREVEQMVYMLKVAGYTNPGMWARKLSREGIGPEELRGRIRQGRSGIGSLEHSHGMRDAKRTKRKRSTR